MTPLFHRIKEVKPNNLIHQFKRYYFQIPTPRFVNQTTSPRLSEHYFLTNTPKIQAIFQRREQLFNIRVRFFAAPVQIKKEVKVPISRLRLNDEIKAEFIRLVTDEGHSVISRTEALQRAKSLDLDLVEVDRNEKPPVCKIYDYNREKYKKKVKDKERAKIKSAGSVRRGECKEVRFSAKTEQKDLNMKADTIKRLMDRGYRVKCAATGSEDDDLSGMISQLFALIEDVAFVEFGPKTERRQAYLIVRHIKYGTTKKGGGKAKDKTAASPEIFNAAAASPAVHNVAAACSDSPEYFEGADSAVSGMDSDEEAPLQGEEESTWSVTSASSAPQNFDEVFDLSHNVKGSTSFHDTQMRFDREGAASTEYNNASRSSIPRDPSFTGPNARQVPQETENRYARSAAKNTSVMRNSMRFPNNGTHPQRQPQHQPHLTVPPPKGQSPSEGEHNPPRNVPLPRDEIPRHFGEIQDQSSQPNVNFSGSIVHRQPPINDGSLASKSNGFGVFSSIKVNANNTNSACPSDGSISRGPGVVTDNLHPPTTKFDDGPRKSESADKKWGIFSK